ncbi:MAG: hypothetical protein QXR41_02385 [Nitrososphaerota archaeon]
MDGIKGGNQFYLGLISASEAFRNYVIVASNARRAILTEIGFDEEYMHSEGADMRIDFISDYIIHLPPLSTLIL